MYIVRTESENKKELNKLIKRFRSVPDSSMIHLVQTLDAIHDNPEECRIRPLSLYVSCLDTLQENSSIREDKYISALEYAEKIYPYIFPNGESTANFERLAGVFTSFFKRGGVIQEKCFNEVFYNLFRNKENYINFMSSLPAVERQEANEKLYIDYAVQARSYFPDEEMFTANIILVAGRIFRSPEPQLVYSREVSRLEHMAGIYDVDEALILRAEQKIQAANDIVAKSKEIIETLDKKAKSTKELTDASSERIRNMCENEISLTEERLKNINADLQKSYDMFLDLQERKLSAEREQLVRDIMAELEVKASELKQQVNDVVNSAKLELSKVNGEAGKAMNKIEGFIRNDSHLKTLINKTAENESLIKKLEKLSVLNDRNLEVMMKNAEYVDSLQAAAENNATEAVPDAKKKGKTADIRMAPVAVQQTVPVQTVAISTQAANSQTIAVQSVDAEEDIIPSVNPLLDETIPFKDRYNIVKSAKKAMEKKGVHFHKMFDDVIMAVMENANPYLIGPSGCGKTFMVSQIASILEMDFIDIGYINEEYDILGFQTANGGYSKPNFYRCYKYGKLAFCDELDNGNSKATVKLNSFLANTENAHYSFPNGENVRRHENFRIIAAGNTAGNGADSLYSTRERIEESVQQRFTPIYVGYDNEVEKSILKDYNDWFEFVVLFRLATDEWSRSSHSEAPGIITTRDVTRIKRYLVNNSFNMDKILDYEFIQTKDESYLAFLSDSIKRKQCNFKNCKVIADRFHEKVQEIRNGLVVR